MNQNYPVYEVIIADDGSTDGSSEWIREQLDVYPNLRLVHLDAEYVKMHGKKIALTLAFKKAAYNYFILTDADCRPVSAEWLQQMFSGFGPHKQIVLGFSPYEKRSGLLNALIRYETFTTALNCFGFAAKGKPYMGVGRNLAYSRELYQKVGGFSTHSHLPAGDDDLFVQSAATPTNTAVVLNDDALTISEPKITFRGWWKQKIRHLWVGKYYTADSKRMLSVLPLIQFFFILACIAWAIIGKEPWYFLVAVAIKWLPEWWIKGRKAAIFQCHDLIWMFPVLSFLNYLVFAASGTAAFFSKKPKW